jgi:hypothetical protein
MKKIILILLLAFLFASCDESGDKKITVKDKTPAVDSTKAKELELKEKELDLKEKQLQQDKEIAERNQELSAKERELAAKEQQLKEQQNKHVSPPPDRNKGDYYNGCPGKYPEGTTRNLTVNDVVRKTKYQLKIMRNEIFARHGYIFQSSDLRNYFNKQAWYSPRYNDVTSMLSDIEKSNVNLIKSYE